MGAMIWISGEGTISPIEQKDKDAIEAIKDGWGEQSFSVSDKGILEFNWDTTEGCTPVEDGVEVPLNTLVKYAEDNGLSVDGEWAIGSDYSDFDNITIVIEDNKILYANTEIRNATTEELVAELKRRGEYPA